MWNLVQSFDKHLLLFNQLNNFVTALFGCKPNFVDFLQQIVTQRPITEQTALLHLLHADFEQTVRFSLEQGSQLSDPW